MSKDEIQIRDLVQRWHSATMTDNTAAVLALMTDDVIFLTSGREPMSKSEFAALSSGSLVQRGLSLKGARISNEK